MGRSESKQAFQQSQATARQNQANAQASLASTNKAVADYNTNVGNFMRFGRQTFGRGGEYERSQSAINTQAAAAGSRALEGDMALHALRTGENTAGYADAAAEARRKATQDITGNLAGANADRLTKLAAIEQTGLDASKYPAQIYSSLYGTGIGGANSQQSSATEAAKTPGFWDVMAPAIVGAAGSVAGGYLGGKK